MEKAKASAGGARRTCDVCHAARVGQRSTNPRAARRTPDGALTGLGVGLLVGSGVDPGEGLLVGFGVGSGVPGGLGSVGKGVSGGPSGGGRVISEVGSSVLSVPAGTRGGSSSAWTEEATARMARIAVDFMVSKKMFDRLHALCV